MMMDGCTQEISVVWIVMVSEDSVIVMVSEDSVIVMVSEGSMIARVVLVISCQKLKSILSHFACNDTHSNYKCHTC